MQRLPGVDVYILPGTSEDLYRKVLDGDIDAAIITQPPFALPKTCDWAAGSGRASGRADRCLGIAARRPCHLASEPSFVRAYPMGWTPGRWLFAPCRIRPRERYELHALDAISVLVDRGLGVSLVPDWAPPWPRACHFEKLPIADRTFARRIGILWTRSSVRLRLVQSFVKEASVALFPPRKVTPRRKS